MLCKHGELEGEIREVCERQLCHRITGKDHKRKDGAHGDTERLKRSRVYSAVAIPFEDIPR